MNRDAVARAIWDANSPNISYDEAKEGEKIGIRADVDALALNRELADAAISAMGDVGVKPLDTEWHQTEQLIYNLVDGRGFTNGEQDQINQYMVTFSRQKLAGGSDQDLLRLQHYIFTALTAPVGWQPIETAPKFERNGPEGLIIIGNQYWTKTVSFVKKGVISEPECGDLWVTPDLDWTVSVDDCTATHWRPNDLPDALAECGGE